MTPFTHVSDEALLKLTLMNRAYQSETGCWIWKWSTDGHGYGTMYRGGKSHRAHRISYETFVGPIPKGMVLRHSCDNPSCINPSHLCVGTQAENVADREARGRRDVKGEQIGTAKLTAKDVLEIRSSSEGSTALAKRFNVHVSNVQAIRAGKSWRHLIAPVSA